MTEFKLRTILSPLRLFYWRLRKFFETRVFQTSLQEFIWRYRHLFYRPGMARKQLDTRDHPHRQAVIDAVTRFSPIESVLEIGCSSGPNLALLADCVPKAEIFGVDINARAICVGQRHFEAIAPGRVHLNYGKADDLSAFSSASMDVVFSDAVLMFIGPDKISRVLSEMGRVARKALILHEYHSYEPPVGNYDGGRYVYNFIALAAQLFPSASVTVECSSFEGGIWDRYGRLLTIRLQDDKKRYQQKAHAAS